ncbi:MAG: hypothetical protein ACTHN5_04535 [Phycisphaerae bacterium]
MSYADTWKAAKTKYENDTKSKKPSDKFMGVFRKSSGIETACKDLDTALAKGDTAGGKKALAALQSAGSSYLKTLDTAMKSENALKSTNSSTLAAALKNIMADATEKTTHLNSMTVEQAVGPALFKTVTGVGLQSSAAVKAFCLNHEFLFDYGTGTHSDALKKLQDRAKTKMSQYNTCYNLLKSMKDRQMKKGDAIASVHKLLDEMVGLIAPMNEGLQYCIMMWSDHQQKAVATKPSVKDALLKSDEWKILAKIAPEIEDDMADLQNSIGKLQ